MTAVLTAAPAAVIVVVCAGLPLAWMAGVLGSNPDVWRELVPTRWRLGLIGRTLGYNAAAGVIATAMGLPAGLVLGRGRGLLARLLWAVLPAALLMPSLSYAYGWSQVVRVIRPLVQPWGVTFEPAGVADTARCVWSLAAWLWAVPAGLVGLALRRADTDVAQAAVLDGALLRTTARQLAGTLAASVAVVTVLASQEFAIYEPTGISVVATEVRMVFDTGSVSSATNAITATGLGGAGAQELRLSPDQAARAAASVATALPLVVCTALLATAAVGAAGRSASGDAVTTGAWPSVLDAPAWAVAVTLTLVALNVGLPVWALVGSLHVPFSPGHMLAAFAPEVGGALTLAAASTAVAVVVALSSAGRWTPGLLAVAAGGFLVGGQLLAIATIRLYNRKLLGLDRWAYDNWPVPVAAYVGRFGWLAVAAGRGTWTRPWRDLRAMASLDGAGPVATAWRVVWPLAWPTLLAGAVLVGALSLTEVPTTVLLFPLHPPTLTPRLMTWLHMARFDSMIEASLLMMLAVLVPAVVVVALARLGWRAARAMAVVAVVLIVSGCGRGASTEPLAVWLETGSGPGQTVYPRGLAYSAADDTTFVVDRMARVQHLDRDGHFLNGWALPERHAGKPVGLTVGPDGNVYVPDTHYYRVLVYTPQGKEVRRWGEFGRGPGQFIYPTDIALDAKGRIFVAEYGDNDRVQVFDDGGKVLYQFGSFGQGDGQFIRPQDLVIDGDTVYVTDACNHRICVFTTDGKWVRNLCSVGSGPGQLRFPYGLAMDNDGRLVVSEFGNNRVQRIDTATGRGLGTWGEAGRDPGQLAYPWGVIVDRRGRTIVADAGNNRLQVLRF